MDLLSDYGELIPKVLIGVTLHIQQGSYVLNLVFNEGRTYSNDLSCFIFPLYNNINFAIKYVKKCN